VKGINKILLLSLLLAFVTSCRQSEVLPPETMRDILYELHRADGAIQAAGYNYSHDQEVAGYYKNILDKYGLTQAEFDSALVWYTDHPQIFNKIYPQVIERLDADFENAKKAREEKIEWRRMERKRKAQERRDNIKRFKQFKSVDRLLEFYQSRYLLLVKKWEPQEFCEKNIIIFGQLKKK
jgi:hypothetical protein